MIFLNTVKYKPYTEALYYVVSLEAQYELHW
jgi:hypothetical protein